MFGRNEIVKHVALDEGRYRVQELFPTIQGEGPLAGVPAMFLRMWGCNLRCTFCDTDFTSSTWRPTQDELLEAIAAQIGKSQCIVITGGEPLIHELGPLVCALFERFGLVIQIETAGTVWPDSFNTPQVRALLDEHALVIVCSPKTGRVHSMIEAYCDDYKYIIGARTAIDELDGLPNESTQHPGVSLRLYRPALANHCTVWLQPCEEYNLRTRFAGPGDASTAIDPKRDDEASAASMKRAAELCMLHGYRLSLQTHKIVGLR